MTNQERAEVFEEAGWTIQESPSGEIFGEAGRGRYAIRADEKLLGDEIVFELLVGRLTQT
jgi:hypothetical protein